MTARRFYRHREALVIPDTPRKVLTRIKALARELAEAIGYAEHAHRNHWTAYQKRRSATSIARKKSELRRLIVALPPGVPLNLWEALEGWWAFLWLDHHQLNYDHSRAPEAHAMKVLAEVETRLLRQPAPAELW